MTDDRARLLAAYQAVAEEVYIPFPADSVSEWADVHRTILDGPEPGPWRTDRVPYLREIMDSLGPAYAGPKVVLMKSSQTGGSECALNWLGYIIARLRQSVIVLWPSEDAFRKWSTTRLTPLLETTPEIARLVYDSPRRDSRQTIAFKSYGEHFLAALSAKSTSQLRSFSARYGVCEEIDDYDESVRGQGAPLKLLERALRTHLRAGAKLFLVSTPTTAGVSRIEAEFEQSDQRHFYVPCPSCATFQRLEWRAEDGTYRIVCEKDAEGHPIAATARYACPACGVLFDDRARDRILAAGEWRPTYPARAIRGYHLNSLYSPFVGFADVMREFVDAKRTPEGLQAFTNLWLGVPWDDETPAIEAHALASRSEPYAAEVPHGVGLLVLTVDVQENRLEFLVTGFGAEQEAWIVEWGQLDGSPGAAEVWAELAEVIRRPWQHESGRELTAALTAIDANYLTPRVHDFIRQHPSVRVLPTIGRAGAGRDLIRRPPRRRDGSRGSWIVGVDTAKDIVVARLKRPAPGPGYLHIPNDMAPEFFDQLCSERVVVRRDGGRLVRRWQKLSGRRNEVLDMLCLAVAGLHYFGPRTIARLGAMAERLSAGDPAPESAA